MNPPLSDKGLVTKKNLLVVFSVNSERPPSSLIPSHIIGFHVAETSTLLPVTLPPPDGKSLVYNISISEFAVQPVL